MKKILSLLLVFVIVFSLTSCKSQKDIVSNISSTDVISDSNNSSDEAKNDSSDDTVQNSSSDTTTSSDDPSSQSQISDKKPNNSSSKTSSIISTNKDTQSNIKDIENIIQNNNNNNSSNSNSNSSNSNSEDIQEPDEEPTIYTYELDSTITDYISVNDIIYILLESPNKIVAIDAESGNVLIDDTLESNPGEINLIKNDLWVSFPSLKQIRVYDKHNFTEKNRYSFQHTVHSFAVNDKYIVYACSAQENGVYRYNIGSKEEKQISFYCNNYLGEKIYKDSFPQANTIIKNESGLLYIGESHYDASCLWCLDIETLELKSCFKLNTYGCWNLKRQMFLFEDSIYWSDLRFDEDDVTNADEFYQLFRSGSIGMLYVNNDLVVTVEGLFLKENGTKLLDIFIDASLLSAAITESGHFMYSDNKFIYIIPNITQTKIDGLPYLKEPIYY